MEELAEKEKQNNPDVTPDENESSVVVTIDDDDNNTDAYTNMVNYLSNNIWFYFLEIKNIYIYLDQQFGFKLLLSPSNIFRSC